MSFLGNLQNNISNTLSGQINANAVYKLSAKGESIKLPVAPSSFEMSVSNNNSVININNFGELNMKGKTGLKTINLESFFPAQEYNFLAVSNSETPYSYVDKIENWRINNEIVTLLITDTNIDMPCLIESFSYKEQDGSNDVYYSLSLKEYRYVDSLDKQETDKKTGLRKRTSNTIINNNQKSTLLTGNSILTTTGKAISRAVISGGNIKNTVLGSFKDMVKSSVNINTGSIINVDKQGSINIK